MNKKEHYHFIGMGGIGMSALARILLQRGAFVSGSDLQESGQLRSLRLMGAKAFAGHSADCIKALPPSAQIVCSSSIGPDHLERVAALKRGFSVCHRADILIELAREKPTFGVAGSHGKSSTSALLAWLLADSGEISFALGGLLKPLNSNGLWRDQGPFVVEIDESDGRSFAIALTGGILTNVSSEHLAHWKSLDRLCRAFRSWAQAIKDPNLFVHCSDDPLCCQIASGLGWSYGFGALAHYRIANVKRSEYSMFFDLYLPGNRVWRDLTLPLLGAHQVLNAAAALALADLLKFEEPLLRKRLSNFKGVSRRGELKKSYRLGIHQIAHFDDYAHHPNEVRAFLKGIRSAIGNRTLIAIFQPHRFTRLRDCFEDFIDAFDAVDHLWICSLYSAGEVPIEGIDSDHLVKRLTEHIAEDKIAPFGRGRFLRSAQLWRDKSAALPAQLANGGIICTLGAGDIDSLDLNWLEGE